LRNRIENYRNGIEFKRIKGNIKEIKLIKIYLRRIIKIILKKISNWKNKIICI
jgi:hypothetical protein